jgi:hypothetical protein
MFYNLVRRAFFDGKLALECLVRLPGQLSHHFQATLRIDRRVTAARRLIEGLRGSTIVEPVAAARMFRIAGLVDIGAIRPPKQGCARPSMRIS